MSQICHVPLPWLLVLPWVNFTSYFIHLFIHSSFFFRFKGTHVYFLTYLSMAKQTTMLMECGIWPFSLLKCVNLFVWLEVNFPSGKLVPQRVKIWNKKIEKKTRMNICRNALLIYIKKGIFRDRKKKIRTRI